MDKFLVKDLGGRKDLPQNSVGQLVNLLIAGMSEEQLDRFYRARQVFFIPQTSSFEFEDSGA